MKEETKRKISESIIEYWNKKGRKPKRVREGEHKKRGRPKKEIQSILGVSKRTQRKIFERMDIGCFECGWKDCPSDIHHIVPRCKGGGDESSNLTYLCPNCHRKSHRGLIKEFISMDKKFGETWKDFYDVSTRWKDKRN